MSDERYIAICGLGKDRPGLVAEATRFLNTRGGNVEDSRAVVLGAEFGLMILASGTAEAIRRIQDDRSALEEATGLSFQLKETVSPEEHRRARALPYRIEANAMDHEGIVHALTDVLHRSGINIVSLETTVRNAPVTGTEIFSLVARVDIPDDVTPSSVRDALAAVAHAQNLDVEMRPET